MSNKHEELRKNQSFTEWYGCGKYEVMDKYI